MNKHTSGPWEVMEGSIVGPNIGSSEEKWLRPVVVKLASATSLANLNLMLAAPELLEALETLVEHFEYYMGDNECRPLENARAAIAKATGERT